MGSILSQAGQKCYREGEKSERGSRVRGILRTDFLLLFPPAHVKCGFALTEKARLLFCSQPRLRKSALTFPRAFGLPDSGTTAYHPLRPASLEAS
jgi:hypothetical protein